MAVITIIIIELNILVSFRVIKERGREREREEIGYNENEIDPKNVYLVET